MIAPNKELGQNFLRNDQIINLFVKETEVHIEDIIYEIGPGEGVITKKYLENKVNFSLTAIDIDERSIEELQKIKDERFKILHKDILKFLPEISDTEYKIVGAIPYNITSPIIHRIIEKENLPQKIVLIIQKEVAEKICDTEKSSYMSLLVSYFYETKFVKKISRDDFYPSPKVDSGLIVLNLKKDFPEVDVNKLSPFLHKVFRTPRKKLNKVFAKEKLESLSISPDLRPENLKIEDIIKLYNLEVLGKN